MSTKDAYYFPHDSNAKRDPKMLMLRHQLGAEGYGLYWMLIEDLREQDSYALPVAIIPALAKEYDTSETKLKAVIEGYGLFDIENDKFFFSHSLVKRMQTWNKNKEFYKLRAEKAAKSRWQKALGKSDIDASSIAKASDKQCSSNAQAIQSDANPMLSDAIREDKIREDKIREDNNNTQTIIGVCVSEICQYFSFTEMSDFKKYKEATQFCTLLNTNKQLERFKEQFTAYISYKEASGEKRHRFASFLGTSEEHYMDGGWNAANWVEELSRTPDKSSGNYVDDFNAKMAKI